MVPFQHAIHPLFFFSFLRAANIYYSKRNQLTKAKSILEQLRPEYSDPAINMHLGSLYLKQALHNEAINQFNKALESNAPSVMNTDTITNQAYYKKALALDKQFTYVDRDSLTLSKAISAWEEFSDNYNCTENKNDQRCVEAVKRIKEMNKIKKDY